MVVFSSLQPEQIYLGRTNARGVIDFKHFLEFAKHGPRAIAEALRRAAFDDGKRSVAAVSRLGFCRAQNMAIGAIEDRMGR